MGRRKSDITKSFHGYQRTKQKKL